MKIINKIMLALFAVAITFSASEAYTVTTTQPIYQPQNLYSTNPYYNQYQSYNALTPVQPAQPVVYPGVQPYGQNYNQGYYPNPYQAQYNPYANPYGYGNNLPATVVNSAMSGLGRNTGGASGIAKNILQQVIYSKMRGY